MAKISNGSPVKKLNPTEKINEVSFKSESKRTIQMWINNDSLSYLTIEEALNLRDELQNALRIAFELDLN